MMQSRLLEPKRFLICPLHLKEPTVIFTCSLTDFFHEAIDSYREEAWAIIKACPRHIFQILTKRPERILKCLPADWGQFGNDYRHVWFGTSVGHQKGAQRITTLIEQHNIGQMRNKIFLSLEPLQWEHRF